VDGERAVGSRAVVVVEDDVRVDGACCCGDVVYYWAL